jgi:hypothetical protein
LYQQESPQPSPDAPGSKIAIPRNLALEREHLLLIPMSQEFSQGMVYH